MDQTICTVSWEKTSQYDYKLKKRYKTIELQIEETTWVPNENDRFSKKPVYIRVHYYEKDLREKLKENGAVWNPEKKLWKVSLQIVLDLHIEDRIIKFV